MMKIRNQMKILKKIVKIVIILVVFIIVGVWLFSRTLHPTYNGEIELNNLSDKVTVYYDDIGVPHINATNEKDATIALGYVHAQDRLWQMELIRRIAAGRLSEVFGKKLLRTDVFFSGLGIEDAAKKTIANIDKNSKAYQLTLAYLKGVNQFIEEGSTPIEFYLIGLEKEKYTIKDIYNVFGYMAFSFAAAHKTDPLLTEIKEKLGDEYLEDFNIFSPKNTTLIKNEINPEIKAGFAAAIDNLYENLPIPPFIGSNSWVVAPEKTKNGKVIFVNDPHIGFAQPSVWYQAHIKTPTYEMYGFYLGLTPFPLLGHNRRFAYGLTMFENDDIDFFFEQNHPDNPMKYKTPTGYSTYKIAEKRIKIKGEKDTTFQVKVSRHGPIMNGVIDHLIDKRPIAMQWIYTKLDNTILEVGYEMSHAKSLSSFRNATSKLHAPGLNIMYGDVKNNIAWFASARLYKYRDSLHTKMILDGASGKDDIVELVNFEKNPQAINPNWKYVYSANNQPDTVDGFTYPGYYLPEDRAKRIVELLEAKNDFTKEDMSKMVTDITSSKTSEIIANLTSGVDVSTLSSSEKKALHLLKNWNGTYGKTNVEPTIYNKFLYNFFSNTFKDELKKGFSLFLKTYYKNKILAIQVAKEKSVWWDDITTPNKKETRQDILTNSFKSAISFLQNQLGENVDDWKWERVISVEYKHSMGEVPALRKYFNVGPFKTSGGNEVINNQIFSLDSTGVYKIYAGPSTRRVIDFSDIENSLGIIPTGQSGNIFSPHYKDQAQKYLNGKFVKMMLNQKEIETSKNKLVLLPKE